MLSWLITIGAVAIFTSLVIVFVNIILDLFDKVVNGIRKWIAAKKAMRVTKDGTVEAATITVDENGVEIIHRDDELEPISINDIDDPILKEEARKAAQNARERGKEATIVETKMDKETENEIRRRRNSN